MDIDDGILGSRDHCQLVVRLPAGMDARFESWYNEPCKGDRWRVSWGYSANKDSAVMTVVP